MPYLPIAPSSDDRRVKQGCPPIRLVNCLVRPTPTYSAKARRAPLFISPAPGRTLRATVSHNVRGLFAKDGCRNGHVFIPNGIEMSEMDEAYLAVYVGAIADGNISTDIVTMRADRSDLGVRAFGRLYNYNGTAFSQVTDADAPSYAQTLAIVARRWVAAFQNNDAFGWTVAGDYSDWPVNNQAQDQDLPDPIVGQENIAGDLWSFNSESTEIWQATGGAETTAFAKLPGARIPFGLAGRSAIAQFGGGAMLLAHTRQVMGTSGYDMTPVPNPALEEALKSLSVSELRDSSGWSYRTPGKEFWGINASLPTGHVFDSETGLWHERAKFGASMYDIDFACAAFGKVFVASRQTNKVWSLEEDVYTDAGDPIVRDMTVHIPSVGEVPVNRLVFDIITRDVPITGDGSSPAMRVRVSNDNGETWSEFRTLSLPTASNKFRVQDFAWGMASHEHGMLVHMQITDPIGFSIWGLWVNPDESELNA